MSPSKEKGRLEDQKKHEERVRFGKEKTTEDEDKMMQLFVKMSEQHGFGTF